MRPLFGKGGHESVSHKFQELILVLNQILGFEVNWNYISNMELGVEYGTEYRTGGTLMLWLCFISCVIWNRIYWFSNRFTTHFFILIFVMPWENIFLVQKRTLLAIDGLGLQESTYDSFKNLKLLIYIKFSTLVFCGTMITGHFPKVFENIFRKVTAIHFL